MKMTVDMKTNKMNLHVLRHGRYVCLSALVLAVCTPATLVAGFVQQSAQVGFRTARTVKAVSSNIRVSIPAIAASRRARTLRMSAEDPAKKDMVPIRKGDPDILKAMAKDEAEAGNATGAERLNTIADRMQTIMDRSAAKMSSKLDVADWANSGEGARWPYFNDRLIARGRDVWVSSTEQGPKSARGASAFGAGSFVTWKFRVNQLSGPMCIGLTSLAVDLDREWTLDEYFMNSVAKGISTISTCNHEGWICWLLTSCDLIEINNAHEMHIKGNLPVNFKGVFVRHSTKSEWLKYLVFGKDIVREQTSVLAVAIEVFA